MECFWDTASIQTAFKLKASKCHLIVSPVHVLWVGDKIDVDRWTQSWSQN